MPVAYCQSTMRRCKTPKRSSTLMDPLVGQPRRFMTAAYQSKTRLHKFDDLEGSGSGHGYTKWCSHTARPHRRGCRNCKRNAFPRRGRNAPLKPVLDFRPRATHLHVTGKRIVGREEPARRRFTCLLIIVSSHRGVIIGLCPLTRVIIFLS
jgi:hypothetical protein